MVLISPHALDRYRERHPAAEEGDVAAALAGGEGMSPEVVWAITQRRGVADVADRYVHAGGGIFVVRGYGDGREQVRTWLRLSEAQEAALARGLRRAVVTRAELLAYAQSLQGGRRDGSVLRVETVDKLLDMVIGCLS